MGPPGLWKELRRHGAAVNLQGPEVEELLSGKKVAVDCAVWLYEAQNQADVVRAYGGERAALKVIFERCVRWIRKGVLPVMVLEGTGGGRANRTFSRGRGGLGSCFAPQSKVRAMLTALGVPWVDAEGEAEAGCAALVSAGRCDFAATTDFDSLLFGAPRVLRGLSLQCDASRCELWEAAAIERTTGLDRRALVAAAFLTGCDYDCRSEIQSTPRDGEGVRGVGPCHALKLAHSLRIQGDGDALKALSGVLSGADPASSTTRKLSRAASDPLPHHVPVPAAKAPRTLSRTLSRAAEDPQCANGFLAAVRQYNSVVNGATDVGVNSQPFAWAGPQIQAEAIIGTIFPGRAAEKLDPLHLEWSLRTMAECPAAVRRNSSERHRWALSRGLRYIPLSAKMPCRRKSKAVPYVLVEFAAVSGGDVAPLRFPAGKKHARVSLAKACEILEARAPQKKRCSNRRVSRRQLRLSFFRKRNSCAAVKAHQSPFSAEVSAIQADHEIMSPSQSEKENVPSAWLTLSKGELDVGDDLPLSNSTSTAETLYGLNSSENERENRNCMHSSTSTSAEEHFHDASLADLPALCRVPCTLEKRLSMHQQAPMQGSSVYNTEAMPPLATPRKAPRELAASTPLKMTRSLSLGGFCLPDGPRVLVHAQDYREGLLRDAGETLLPVATPCQTDMLSTPTTNLSKRRRRAPSLGGFCRNDVVVHTAAHDSNTPKKPKLDHVEIGCSNLVDRTFCEFNSSDVSKVVQKESQESADADSEDDIPLSMLLDRQNSQQA